MRRKGICQKFWANSGVTAPVSNENTVNITTEITDGKAVVNEITRSDIDKIVDNGASGTSENTSITIDLSEAKSEVTSVELSDKTMEMHEH